MKPKPKLINMKVETNIKEILEKLERLEALLKEVNYITNELASDGLEINIDMQEETLKREARK